MRACSPVSGHDRGRARLATLALLSIRLLTVIVGGILVLLTAGLLLTPLDHVALARLRSALISVGGLSAASTRSEAAASAADARLVAEIEQRAAEIARLETEWDRLRLSDLRLAPLVGEPAANGEADFPRLVRELATLRAQRHAADMRAQSARELQLRNAAETIPEVQKSPFIQGLLAQRTRAERDLMEMALQLQPAHPRMKQLNALLAEIRRRLKGEIAAVVERLQLEAKASARREANQSRALIAAASRLPRSSAIELRLAELEDKLSAGRRALTDLRDRQTVTCCKSQAHAATASVAHTP